MNYYDTCLPRPGNEQWKSLEAEPILGGVRVWLLRRSVNHKKLGYGIIVDYYYDEGIILVEFSSSKELTRFKYPDAFDDGPLKMVYSIAEAYGFVSQDLDDKDL